MWDTFMFHAVIKKRGRVPAQDGFIARRIAGPGLASNYFYQVRQQKHCVISEVSHLLHEFIMTNLIGHFFRLNQNKHLQLLKHKWNCMKSTHGLNELGRK